MKEKTKKILEIIISIVAVIWVGFEVTSYYPEFTIIVGVMVMWGIVMYLLRKKINL